MSVTTHIPRNVSQFTREKIERFERDRQAKREAQRGDKAKVAALLAERRADLEMADEEIAAVEALHSATMAELNQRRSELRGEVVESEAAETFLLASLPCERHARELRYLEARTESARNVLAEPAPELRQNPNVSDTELREIFEREKSEHAQRAERARTTIATLEPIVEELQALALTANPTEQQVQEILARYEP